MLNRPHASLGDLLVLLRRCSTHSNRAQQLAIRHDPSRPQGGDERAARHGDLRTDECQALTHLGELNPSVRRWGSEALEIEREIR